MYIYRYVHIYIYMYVYKYKHCHMEECLFFFFTFHWSLWLGAAAYPCPWRLLHVKSHGVDLPEASQATHLVAQWLTYSLAQNPRK